MENRHNLLKMDPGPAIQVDRKGRRRYVSRQATTDPPYTYALPSNGYSGTGYSSGLGAYDSMSKYSRTYDYSNTYGAGSRSRDLDTPSSSSSRYGLSSGSSSYGLGTSRVYDGSTSSRYNTRTRNYDTSSGNHDNNTRNYDYSTGTSDTSSRLSSYSSRYDQHGDPENTETKTKSSSSRTVRPSHQRYRLVDEDKYAAKSSSDVKTDDIRSRRYRTSEKESEQSGEKFKSTQGRESYRDRKRSDNQESFELERPVFSSVEDSVDLKPYSFRSRDRYSDSRVTSESKERTSENVSKRDKLRNYSDNTDMPEKQRSDRKYDNTSSVESSRRHWRKSSEDENVKTNGIHPKQSNVSVDGKELALTVDSSDAATDTKGLSGWRRRRLEREQREKAKAETDASEKHSKPVDKSDSVRHIESTPSLGDEKTLGLTQKRHIEKIERPKSVDADTIKNILLTSDSPLLRSRYREAVRKKEELQSSSEKSSVSENVVSEIPKQSDSHQKSHIEEKTQDKKSSDKKIEKNIDDYSLKFSPVHDSVSLRSRTDKSSVSSHKDGENNIAKDVQRNENKGDQQPETKRRILVSRSRVDNLRDSVKRNDEQESKKIESKVSAPKDDDKGSDPLKTSISKKTDLLKEKESERPLYSRRLLSSTSSKDEKQNEKPTTDQSVSEKKSVGEEKSTTSSEKLSKRAAHARRAKHHLQEGPSLVKHMSDLLFEDPKSVRSERLSQSELKSDAVKEGFKTDYNVEKHSEKSDVLSKDNLGEKSQVSASTKTSRLHGIDSEKHKQSAKKIMEKEKFANVSKEKFSVEPQVSVPLTQFSARKTDYEPDKMSSRGKKLNTEYTEPQEKKTEKIEMKSTESDKSEKMTEKLYQPYGRAKTTDVASLLKKDLDETESQSKETTKKVSDDLANLGTTTMANLSENTQLSRAERIAKYKEERKRQLAYISNKFGNLGQEGNAKDVVPSLFHAAREESKEGGDSLSRSRSLREESPQKFLSPVLRSKSLREDLSPKKKVVSSNTEDSETVSSGKKTSVMSIDESGKEMPLTEKIAHNRKLFEQKSVDDEKESTETKKIHRKSLTDTTGQEQAASWRRKSSSDENYLEKVKHRYLFGTDFSESKARKSSGSDAKEEKIEKVEKLASKSASETENNLHETNQEKADETYQKRRRQLPSIPMVLGEISPIEGTESKSSNYESYRKNTDSKLTQELSHPQDLSSVSSTTSSLSSNQHISSSKSSASSSVSDQHHIQNDKPVQGAKQEFLSPTAMKPQLEMNPPLPLSKDTNSSQRKLKTLNKQSDSEENRSQTGSGCSVNTQSSIDSKNKSHIMDTNDILEKFKELETMPSETVDSPKPQGRPDTLDSEILSSKSKESSPCLETNKIAKPLSIEVQRDKDIDKNDVSKISDDQINNPKSTKIRRRSPVRSRIPVSPVRKIADQEKESHVGEDSKPLKDKHVREVSKVSHVTSAKETTVKQQKITDSSKISETSDAGEKDKINLNKGKETNIEDISTHANQKEKFVTEVKKIEITKKSAGQRKDELPVKGERKVESKIDEEQRKPVTGKEITSTEAKISKESKATSREVFEQKQEPKERKHSNFDKNKPDKDMSNILSQKGNMTVESKTSERTEYIPFTGKDNNDSRKGESNIVTRAPQREITKTSTASSEGRKDSIVSTTSIEIKPIEKPGKDLKNIETVKTSELLTSENVSIKDGQNLSKPELLITDSKSSDVKVSKSVTGNVSEPVLAEESNTQSVSEKVDSKATLQVDTSAKQKSYSSDESGKSGKVKTSKTRHLKSTSGKSSKSGGLQRSKTITEKELKSPLILKKGPKEGASAVRSKEEIRNILSKSPEANLDDLLLQNVEYLSDIETKEPWAVKREPSKKASDDEQTKVKRFHRKKNMQRRKSESDSGKLESKERLSADETTKSKKGEITSAAEKKHFLSTETVTIHGKTENRLNSDTNRDFIPGTQDNKVVTSVGERTHAVLEDSTRKPASIVESVQSHSAKQEKFDDSTVVSTTGNLSIDKKSDASLRGEVTLPDKSQYISDQELQRMKAVDKATDSDSTTVSEESSGRSPRSDLDRKRRKDKTSVRKSSLNVATDETTDVGRRGLTAEDRHRIGARSPSLSSSSSLNKDDSIDNASAKKNIIEADEVSSAISKFSGEGKTEKNDSLKSKREDDSKSPRRIPRRNNFSSLLQKFSGSEQSSSENEQTSFQKKTGLRRQEAYTLTSSEESETRRTPERTQSLRVKKSPSPDLSTNGKGVQRSESFKSDFMKRRYSPEPENRIPLTDDKEMAQPNPELAAILNRRQKVVTDQQIAGAEKERERITSKNVEKEEFRPSAAEVEEVIADSEVASVLKARRKEIDMTATPDTKKTDLNGDSELKSEVKILQTEPTKSHSLKSEVDFTTASASSHVKSSSCSSSSHEHDIISKKSHDLIRKKSHDKDGESTRLALSDTKLGMSAIDTSLEILSTVAKDSESPKQSELEMSLTKVKVDSDEDVAKFITDVQKSKLEQKESVSSVYMTKSDLDRKSDKTVRKSPERVIRSKVSPSRENIVSEKGSVVETVKSSTSLRRAESYRTKEVEKPKGILKRTTSMKKSGVIVDPELAGILQQRRQQQGDEEEEDSNVTLSAKKDIAETISPEPEERREKELNKTVNSDDEDTTHMSIQERIYHMKTRLDESKSCPITPKSISGAATPKFSYKGRTGSVSSGYNNETEDGTRPHSHVSGEQLIEKLSNLADKSHETVTDKRKKFQQRSRDDWRTRTQPVTIEEIHEADSLDSVISFRREVLKNASKNVFENIQKQTKAPVTGAKSEFPQPFRGHKVRRSRSERHKTLPITAAELSAIPEGESAGMTTLRNKSELLGKRDSKADSGILSGSSDVEGYYDHLEKESYTTGDSLRSLSLEMDINEDDPATLSVSAKASMFTKLEEKSKNDKPKSSASGAKRYIDRKKRERSRTQPVTEDEVKTAAEIADGPENEAEGTEAVTEKQQVTTKPDEDAKETDDDLSRRTLAEKVKLFSSLKEQEKQQQKAEPPPVIKRRNRKLASRFNTQPITIEEVEKAAQYRVSPLAMSLVKPPDPEMLKGLSVNAQREIMAQHAEVVMSQPGSRSSSRHSSTIDLSQDSKQDADLGTSKKKEETSKENRDVQSMSKSEKSKNLEKEMEKTKSSQDSTDPKSAVKKHDVDTHEELKRIMLGKTSEKDSEIKTTLKAKEFTDNIISKEVESDVSVLKEIESVKNIQKGSSSDEDTKSELRGILKKEGSFEVKKLEAKEGENGNDPKILKKDLINEQEKMKKEEVVKTERIKEIKSEIAKKEKSPSPDRTEKVLSGGCSSAIRRRGRDPKQPERYLTQPTDSTPEKSPETTRKMKYGQARHKTQPVTPEEKREAEGSPEGVSIKNRLQALQKSGEEDWRKRISKQLDFDGQMDVSVKLREKKRNLDIQRPSSIADRLNLLESSQGGWRERIEEHDAKRFTVAHKLAGQVEESPLVKKIRERTKKDSESESGSDITSPSTPTREWAKIPLPKTIISGTPIVDESKPETAKVNVPEKEEEKDKPPVKVSVPTMDDEELKSFFMSKKEIVQVTSEKVDVTLDDMNEIFIIANDILPSTRKIRPKRKHSAKSKNPLKTMSMTVEVKTEYEEVSSDVAERELRRLQTAKIAKDAGFAQAALAGLASKENFAKVELRKTADAGSGKTLKRLDPYQDVMLLHVKGRRRTQVRLVEPCAKSINSGDCYLLVTPDKIINWVGEFSNVIEKAKAADVASFICQKRDMGCKAGNVETVEEKRQHLGAGKKFWSVLGGLGTISSAGPPEEDELYENHIVETNMVYRLQNNSLTPYQEYWGLQPKHEMLKKDEVLVFDFGSELYVWQGKAVKPDQRKMGVKLARQLWEKGYDYEACDINPISPLTTEEFGGPPVKSNERPPWALFGKVNQNMETILFREKFSDWPDTSRLIKVKSTEEIAGSRSDLSELKPYDASLMIPVNTKPVSLILEGSHVGRGVNWSEDMEGFIREQNIVTLGVKVWHVLEYDHYEVPDSSYGQFHDGDTYVVRWQYMITNKGTKDLKGTQSKRTNVGRERCAYFFWQGKSSTINEKGASALMTVELDEERGPQVRVDEGKEMPCFLNLFGGRMIIHIGKREEESTNTQGSWRCYCVRNDYENELCLLEVPKGASQLRSHSSLLMLNVNSGLLYIWHGCKSPPHTRKLAKLAAERLKEKCPLEVGMKEDTYILISEMDENSEKEEFWSFLDIQANDRSPYHSLLNDSSTYDHTLRLFHLSSVSGVFEVQEILNPSRTPDVISPFPFLQSDLYKASQPALFLVDNCKIVYLWHGWWPEGDAEIENIQTGSAKARFCVDRKCAIDTAMHYCKLKNPENPPKAVAVHAGLEPLEFTNVFPFWDIDEAARSLNLKDGKTEGEITPLEEILEKVTQTRYTYEELLEDPLPEGVDPLRLESYLDDDEFDEIMEMSREEFYALPGWKQGKIKQQVGLF